MSNTSEIDFLATVSASEVYDAQAEYAEMRDVMREIAREEFEEAEREVAAMVEIGVGACCGSPGLSYIPIFHFGN